MKKSILDHELVPEHIILEDAEAEKLLKKLEVIPEQLPKIKITDPVVKKIDAKVGNILKINRKSQTAGSFVTYRLVQE